MRILAVFALSLPIALGGCGKAEPAGFWSQYSDGQLTHHLSQQGSRGGWRALHKTVRTDERFAVQKIKSFAAENGWTFISEKAVPAESMATWITSTGKAVFPLGYDGFASGKNDAAYDRFPRWITTNATLLTFDSGWITAVGGVDQTAYGFVVLSEDGKAMSVYHLWGE